jgi:hypothetical protein
MEGNLILSAAPLANLCRLLGIDTSDLSAVEGVDELAHTFPVQPADAARLNVANVRAFVDHYGDAARIEIRTGDLTELILHPGVSEVDITSFAEQAASGGPYEAIVNVDKTRLAQRRWSPWPSTSTGER